MEWREHVNDIVGGLFAALGFMIGIGIMLMLVLGAVRLAEIVGAW